MRQEDSSIETNRLQVLSRKRCKQLQYPFCKKKNVGRIEKCGGEELKNAFDMIHEQGYSLCYKFFLP